MLLQRHRGVFFYALIILAAALLSQAGNLLQAWDSSSDEVELQCKILPASGERAYVTFKVELRKSTGEPIRQAYGGSGDKVRFKRLTPGIYILCLFGDKGRSGCRSVDLTPESNEKSHIFVREIQAPSRSLNQVGAHRVSKSRLAVPEKAHKELIRAEEAQVRGEREEALRHLERALVLHPDYIEALNNLGTYYHRAGDYSRSIEQFRKATKLEPEFFAGWVNLGGSLLAAGQFEPALEANKRAVRLRPNDALANAQMGINYFYLHQLSDAKNFFLKALRFDPASANAPHLYLAHIAFAEHRTEEAKNYIRSFLELHPNSPQAPHLRQTLQNLSATGLVNPRDVAQP